MNSKKIAKPLDSKKYKCFKIMFNQEYQPKGGRMANEGNLKKGIATQFKSGEEAARNGAKGGIASGAARRRKRRLQEAADLFLSLPVTDQQISKKLVRRGLESDDIDIQMAIIAAMSDEAMKGNPKAAKILVDLLDDKQEEKEDNAGVYIIDDV